MNEKRAPYTVSNWKTHAYPLQQVVIHLQGTRHSDRNAIIEQLETVLSRLRSGDMKGTEHDDDFGYSFECRESASGPSFFGEDPAGAA
jgi:hypothetical protein